MTFDLADLAHLAPATVHFCEARLDAWPREPANTWSSLGYLAVGAWLLARRGAASRIPLLIVALAEIGIGLGSIALHGTGTFAGEVLDLSGMFMLSACMAALGIGRLLAFDDRRVALIYAVALAAPLVLLALLPASGIASFAVVLAAAILAELALQRRERSPHFRRFGQALGLFALAFAIWTLDITRLVCRPDNHLFTGHAAWHLLNALCIERLFTFYRDSLPARRPVEKLD